MPMNGHGLVGPTRVLRGQLRSRALHGVRRPAFRSMESSSQPRASVHTYAPLNDTRWLCAVTSSGDLASSPDKCMRITLPASDGW